MYNMQGMPYTHTHTHRAAYTEGANGTDSLSGLMIDFVLIKPCTHTAYTFNHKNNTIASPHKKI